MTQTKKRVLLAILMVSVLVFVALIASMDGFFAYAEDVDDGASDDPVTNPEPLPDEPSDPGESTEPTDPTPVEPTEPTEPTEPSEQEPAKDDGTSMPWWIIALLWLAVVAVLSIIGLGIFSAAERYSN